jgi:peptidoglycan/xylan/chitin deacetylase (PgdA/CDA1 family)
VHDVTIPPIKDGLAPVISRLETKEPVVFLGIDDGTVKRLSDLDLMRKHKIKSSLFLANSFVKDNPLFFKQFTYFGNEIENHSQTHRLLSRLSYDQQKEEICGQADRQKEQYGRRPVLFRPPGGDWNQDTQRAAADCGMKAIVLWIAKANGGGMQYQVGNGLRAGDIVLMHFRPEFPQDMQAFLDAQNAAGLHTELLTDWLAPSETMTAGETTGRSAP